MSGRLFQSHDHASTATGWQMLTADEARQWLQWLTPVTSHEEMARFRVHARQCSLPFYRQHRLVHVTVMKRPDRHTHQLWILAAPDRFYVLDGTASAIHAINERESLLLSLAQVADYLRFFTAFIRSGDLDFVLVESSDDLELPDADLTETERQFLTLIQQECRPMEIFQPLISGSPDLAHCKVVMVFRGRLFRCLLAVKADGQVMVLKGRQISASVPGRLMPLPVLLSMPEHLFA